MASSKINFTKIFVKTVGIVAGAYFIEKQLNIFSAPAALNHSISTKDGTQQNKFLSKYLMYDGRGIKIAKPESLQQTSKDLPKIIDIICNETASKNTQETINCSADVDKKPGTFLTTYVIIINPENEIKTEAVVLFDTGSQQTFITNNIIDHLNLATIKTEKLKVYAAGAISTKYNSSVVKFEVKTKDGCKEIYANSIKDIISTTVPIIEMEESDSSKTSITYRTPDILIGTDYFFDFITSFEKIDDDMYIIDSVVGKMLCKKMHLQRTKDIVEG